MSRDADISASVVQLVPFDMSLASVKKFIWRRSEDVLFMFTARDPANIPPLPKIAPPS
jgi:hypothetical protein